jgi:ABC-type transport system involved in cytochrome bd biosynthesis fused ATPase/permease subunit
MVVNRRNGFWCFFIQNGFLSRIPGGECEPIDVSHRWQTGTIDLGMKAQTMIRVVGVTQHYGVKPVLKDLSFEIPAGSRTVVIGPNGMGKTTLLSVLGGVLNPQHGYVEIDGLRRRSSVENELRIRKRVIHQHCSMIRTFDHETVMAFPVDFKDKRGPIAATNAEQKYELSPARMRFSAG